MDQNSVHIVRMCADAVGRLVFVLRGLGDASPTVMLLEAGGAVTYCHGLTQPRTCMSTTVPNKLKPYFARSSGFSALILSFIRDVIVPDESEKDTSTATSWLAAWSDRLVSMSQLPLYWEESSGDIVAAWARCAALGSCPVLPGQPLSSSTTPVQASCGHTHQRTATGSAMMALRDTRVLQSESSPTHPSSLSPVFLWTPDSMAWLCPGARVDREAHARLCTAGLAWHVGRDGCEVHSYHWRINEQGMFQYSVLQDAPTPAAVEHVPVLPPSLALWVRRALAQAGYIPHAAASAQAVHLQSVASAGSTTDSPDSHLRVESLLGPGPHMYPLSMVPPLAGEGVLARVAGAGDTLGKIAKAAPSLVQLGGTATGRILSDSMLSTGSMSSTPGLPSMPTMPTESRATGVHGVGREEANVNSTGINLARAVAASLLAEQCQWENEREFRLEQARMQALRALKVTRVQLQQIERALV